MRWPSCGFQSQVCPPRADAKRPPACRGLGMQQGEKFEIKTPTLGPLEHWCFEPPPPGATRPGPSQNFETPPKRSQGPGTLLRQEDQTTHQGRSLKGADNEAPNALKAACEALRKEFAEDYFLAPAKTRLPPDEIVPRLMKLGGQAEACQEALALAKQKKSVNVLVTENKEEWIRRLEKGFSLLFEGVGSKYRLLENFAQVLSKSGMPTAIFQAFDKGSSLPAFLRELLEQHGWKGAGSLPRLCSALLAVRVPACLRFGSTEVVPLQARRAATEKHPLVLIIHNLEVLPAPHLSALASLVATKKAWCDWGGASSSHFSPLFSPAHLRMASDGLPSLAGDLAGCLGSGLGALPFHSESWVSSHAFANEPTPWSAEVDNIFADAAFNMDPYAAMELRDFSFSYEEVHTRDSYYTVELKGRYPDGLPSCTHPLATKKQTKASLGLVLRCLTQNQKELVQEIAKEQLSRGQQGVPWDELVVLASDLMIANNHTKLRRLLSELTDHQILIERHGRFELAVKEAVLRKLAEGESVEDVDVEGEGDAADDVEHEDEEFSEDFALEPVFIRS
ncbi:CPK2 [Symbiodinium sp. CCMP2456]|nr:CPK2 [Symbiodinium sp. CCMP2456]